MKKLEKRWMQILPFMLFVILFLLFAPPVSAEKNPGTYEIESSNIRLTVTLKGEIYSIFDKKSKRNIPFKGITVFVGCSSEVISIDEEQQALIVKKKVVNDNTQVLYTTEVFSFENDLLRWELKILPEGNAPWSTPVQTIWSISQPGLKYWTTWGDPRPEKQGVHLLQAADEKILNGEVVLTDNKLPTNVWADPLVTQPLFPRKLIYGGSIYGDPEKDDNFDPWINFYPGSRRNYFSVPVIGLYNEKQNIGVSLGFSPENIGVEACLEVTNENQLIFSRYNNRFTPGKELSFSTYINLHEADWRSSMAWYVDKFKDWFNPVNPNVHEFSGTSSYSFETGDFDVDKMKKMAYKTNWDATFPFPYMGLFLPDVNHDEGWLSWRGEYLTFKKIDDYYKQMQEKGFRVLSYFNVTEFGSNILEKGKYNMRLPERKQWVNSNTYLYKQLEPAVLYYPHDTTYTNYIYSWDRSIVVDPGEPVYANHLVEQINRYIEKLPHFEGITIDRLDWTRHYNTHRDDGVSWFNDAPARSLHVSWNSIINKIAPILHDKNKVLFINNHVKRLDDIKQVDGIFDEFGDVAASINTNAFLCVNKPLLGWCHNKAAIGNDFDAFMQKHLHLGMYPMAPFPANDHALLPDEEVDQLYLDYGQLLKVMKGKNWVLEPGVIKVVGNKAKANIFKTDSGIIIPVTFGQDNVVTLKVKGIKNTDKIEIIHPGEKEWTTIKTSRGRLKIPLKRGCAMVRIYSP
ncbi:hypothetical protein L3X37_10605 [Sabulilitoribacter arenilitoris]|uniref:Uncharacterized protein n=1 Tax=Wocania arenilitoris TaxID=2044858 RepID=A0AAE3JQ31_9FLAO|nr:hypothetical protein [Wocania arenilitoris]MCF7568810.1 hypothetical protein [Wocania arenilitoris]